MATVEERITARRLEIEALFEFVGEAVAAYEEIPVGLPDYLKRPLEDDALAATTTRIYMDMVDSTGITPVGFSSTKRLEDYPLSPEVAFAGWSHYMDTYLFEHPSRKRLYWRRKPSLERDLDIETKVEYWNVRSRLGVMG